MKKFKIYPRIRKESENPQKFIRLHRAEFAHDFKKKNYNINNYYPDSEILIQEIAKFYKKGKKNIILGLGAESLIKDTIIWHQQKFDNKSCLNTYPNFFMYEIFLRLFNYEKFYFKINALNPSKTNSKMIKENIKKNKISLLILVNPAHPIEKYWTKKEMVEILTYAKQKNTFVIVDEVYQGIGSPSCESLISRFKNLIIIKSFSKTFGYPGLRIGFAVGNKNTIKEIESFRLSHELPAQTINEGVYLLKNYRQKVLPRITKIINARKYAFKEFMKRKCIVNGKYSNSLSIFFKSKNKLKNLGNKLKKNKIIVNYSYPKPYENFLNITTTSKSNLKKFFKIFDTISYD